MTVLLTAAILLPVETQTVAERRRARAGRLAACVALEHACVALLCALLSWRILAKSAIQLAKAQGAKSS